MQLCRCVSYTPRGGGHRDRRRTLRSPSPISPTPLNLFPGFPLRRDITADREGFSHIVCAILVRLYRTRFYNIMQGLNHAFFICADGKKTVLVGAARTFLITADRDGCTNFGKMKSVSPIQGNFNTNLRKCRYSVIEKHPDTSQTVLKQPSRLAVIKETYDLSQTNSVYLPSAQIKNERHNPNKKS